MVSVFPYCSTPSVLTQDCSVDLEFTDSLDWLASKIPGSSNLPPQHLGFL